MPPEEAIDYLRMHLELTPNEYMNTSRAVYETALRYQNARARGTEAARAEHEKQKETERKQRESLERLKASTRG